jgi:hypothetical protein
MGGLFPVGILVPYQKYPRGRNTIEFVARSLRWSEFSCRAVIGFEHKHEAHARDAASLKWKELGPRRTRSTGCESSIG